MDQIHYEIITARNIFYSTLKDQNTIHKNCKDKRPILTKPKLHYGTSKHGIPKGDKIREDNTNRQLCKKRKKKAFLLNYSKKHYLCGSITILTCEL